MRGLIGFAAVLVGCNTTPVAQGAPPAEPAAVATSTVASAAPTPAVAPSTADSAASREADAQRVAEAWLVSVDAGKYAESWTDAASPFRAAIDQPGWVKAMASARAPLGTLKSRALRSAHYATSLPGAPDGQYVVVQFDTSFDHKLQALETVTPMKEADGEWRVSGYFIK